jgi:hypothetical protein
MSVSTLIPTFGKGKLQQSIPDLPLKRYFNILSQLIFCYKIYFFERKKGKLIIFIFQFIGYL